MRGDEDGYHGPATLVVGDGEFEVEVDLRGVFQPIDGRYHWYGRIAAHEALDQAFGRRKRTVELRTPEGSARGEAGDPDTWGRYRVLGTSTPPFALPALAPGPEAKEGAFTTDHP
jgi:uncharacterized protein DUF4873